MNHRQLNELHLRRGRLLERIAAQRRDLTEAMVPVRTALATTDRVVAYVRNGVAYVKAHPSIALIAVAALFVLKTGRTLRWARRGFFAWRTWQALRDRWPMLRARS